MGEYENDFPPEGGPFKIPNYAAKQTLDKLEPVVTVELDLGAFRRLWEVLEAEARRHYPVREALSSARAELRAVTAFREAWCLQALPEVLAEQPPAPKRQLRRGLIRVEAVPQRRILKRTAK